MSFEGFKKASADYGALMEQIVRFNKVKICVEVGVAYGTTMHYLCRGIKHNAGTVHGFDLWAQHGLQNQFGALSSKDQVTTYLQKEGHSNFKLTQIDSKTEAFKNKIAELGLIDFAFIDGCHSYGGVKNDFDIIYPRLSDSGMIMFHDTCVIDGCREFIIDLRTKYYSGEYDIINFPYGGDRRFGLSLLAKRSYSHGVEIDEICGSPSDPADIYEKEQQWLRSKR